MFNPEKYLKNDGSKFTQKINFFNIYQIYFVKIYVFYLNPQEIVTIIQFNGDMIWKKGDVYNFGNELKTF